MNVIFKLGGEFLYGTVEGKVHEVFLIGRYIIHEDDCYFPN